MLASVPDLLRLLVVPVLGWAAWRDVRTRRVPNRTWYPLAALAAIVLAWETWGALTAPTLVARRLFLVRVTVSLGIVAPLGYLFWRIGGFGGADAKALMVVAALFPTYPTFYLSTTALPLHPTTLGVFSLTVLSNTVVVGLAYPVVLTLRNAALGRFGPAMVVGRPVATERVTREYGRLLETPDGLSRRGLDLDALRMYLAWRGTSLSALREDPEAHRDPASLPEEPNDPGDGTVETDGGRASGDADAADPDRDDWGAAAFLADVEGSAYGTTPAQLRGGLDVLATAETVWITPGIPFLVPMFLGLLVGLTYGDVLFALLGVLGLV